MSLATSCTYTSHSLLTRINLHPLKNHVAHNLIGLMFIVTGLEWQKERDAHWNEHIFCANSQPKSVSNFTLPYFCNYMDVPSRCHPGSMSVCHLQMPFDWYIARISVWWPPDISQWKASWHNKGHFTHKTEGPWPLHSKHSHWWKRQSQSKFASHKAWGTNRVGECNMDVKSTWVPTWHQLDDTSCSLELFSKTTS